MAHLGSFDGPRARSLAGPCREGGLSSTDERVRRGHVTEVTGSSEVV
jgi:hypothetical protein